MLELKNIKKDYPAGDGIVNALKGISLNSRLLNILCKPPKRYRIKISLWR